MGLSGLGVADDVAENQLAFAPGVTGVDERVHVLALDQFDQQPEPRLGFLDGLEVEVRRDDGQIRQGPLAALDLELLRHGQFQQMPDCRRKDLVVALVEVILFLETAQRLGDVAGDRRFLRDNQCFSHSVGRLLQPIPLPAQHLVDGGWLSDERTSLCVFQTRGAGRRPGCGDGCVAIPRGCEGRGPLTAV